MPAIAASSNPVDHRKWSDIVDEEIPIIQKTPSARRRISTPKTLHSDPSLVHQLTPITSQSARHVAKLPSLADVRLADDAPVASSRSTLYAELPSIEQLNNLSMVIYHEPTSTPPSMENVVAVTTPKVNLDGSQGKCYLPPSI